VKGVGNGSEISKTRAACQKIAIEVKEENPETVVIISPHSILYSDYFHISPGKSAVGDFGNFRAPDVKFSVNYDEELANLISNIGKNIPAGNYGERDPKLDHGTMVPLYFLNSERIIRVSLSGLSFVKHYEFGMCIKQAIDKLGRKAIIIASGDMSHKLKADGPYGLVPEGAVHDEFVEACLKDSDLQRLMTISPKLVERAAECGLRSIIILAGVMDGLVVESEVFSYEGPYGVGYMTAKFFGDGKAESLLPKIIKDTRKN
jgi:AmmeMemoRadiSam system protein B